MNKPIRKLERIADKTWIIASQIAIEASKWGTDGYGFAVVADETRSISLKLNSFLENELPQHDTTEQKFLSDMATQLSYLALNAAIEASHSGQRGKSVAICAEDIRNLVFELMEMLENNQHRQHVPPPLSGNVMTSVDNRVCFMQFSVDGYRMIENINFIQEVIGNKIERDGMSITLRNSTIPVIDCFSLLGKKNDHPFYLILRTPWAKTNDRFAVAIDELSVHGIFYSPVGVPVSPAPDMPLREFIRECWESTDSEPFRFMDWPKMMSK